MKISPRWSLSLVLYAILLAGAPAYSQAVLSASATWEASGEAVPVQPTLAEDADQQALLAPYRQKLDQIVKEKIGQAPVALTNSNPEGTLGDWTSDVCLERAQQVSKTPVDMLVFNSGGLRAPINAGDISIESIYEVMPFENELVLLELTGPQLQTLLKQIANQGGMPVAGLRMTVSNHQPVEALIAGKPFDASRSYQIATSDYLAQGSSGLTVLKESQHLVLTGLKIRDILIDKVKALTAAGQPVQAQVDGRMREVGGALQQQAPPARQEEKY